MRYLASAICLILCWSISDISAQIQQPYNKNAPLRGQVIKPEADLHPECGFDELLDAVPAPAKERQQKLENQLYNILHENPDYFRQRSATYTIPVVVHIVHQNGSENISEQTVQNGMQHLNDAFANMGYYDQESGVDVDIDFCLARQDPDGNLTNGITRTESPLTVLDKDTQDQDLKDLIRWDPLCYVNIWLVRNIQGNVAGYAYLPGAHGADFDGIVCESVFFGSSPGNSAVTVHEMGHYLGLFHTFQGGCDNNDCLANGDRVCDTPPDNSTAAVPCDNPANTCNTDTNSGFATDQNDMNENYMDYGDRFCYHDFTQGQADRMQFFLTGTRSSLLDCSSCLDPCPVEIAVDAMPNPLPVAVGTDATVTLTEAFTQNYRWLLDGNEVSTSPTLDLPVTELGDFELVIEVSNDNPDCFAYDTLLVQPFCDPAATVQANSDTLNATAGQLTMLGINATDADSVLWLLNGVEIGSGVPLNYTFTELGFQQLVLEAVTPYSDCNGRDTVLVNVTCPEGVSVNLEEDYLLVQFGETVDFASNAMNTTGVEWTLDGMVVGNDEMLTYTFNNFGVFDLIVVGESTVPACNVADVMQVEVECGLPLEVTADESFVISGDTISFAANGTDIQSYEWYVNGQLVSTQQSFDYPFEQGGIYEVYAIVNFPFCEQRSESLIITVQDPCFYDTLDVVFEYDIDAPPRDVVKSAVDDGYLLNFGFQLVKVDGDYQTVWSRSYFDPIFIMGATADVVNGGYYLAYYSLGDGVDASTKIMKIDETGDILWQRGIVPAVFVDQYPELGRVASLPNGNGLVYEEILLTDGMNIFPYTFLVQFTPDGTEVWSRELFLLFVTDAMATADGGVLLSGYNADQSNTLGLVKLDALGNTEWSTSFTPPGEVQSFVGPSFIEQYDDGSFFIGFNALMENELFGLGHVMQVSADGNLRWAQRLYDDAIPLAAQQITTVDKALNGDFLVSLTIPDTGDGNSQQESDIVRISQAGDVRWVRRNPLRPHAITAIRQSEMGELAMFGGFDADNLLYLTDEDGFSGSCEMQARRVDRPERPLDQEFDVYQLDSLLEFEEIVELESENLDAVRSVLCSVEGINGTDAAVEMLSASLCGDSVTINIRICNLGNLPISDTIPVTFYDAAPFASNANTVATLPAGSIVEADSCREVSFTVFNGFTDDKAFLMFNDDGTASLPFNFIRDFPTTGEEECNFYNNLDSLSLEGLPVTPLPGITLGADTVLCPGDSLLLQGPGGFSEYEWQDGSTDQDLVAPGPGVYYLEGRIACGGTTRDTIVIEAPDSLSLDLGPDLSGCQNQVFDLNAGAGFETYLWQDNSFDSVYTAFDEGLYWVETTDRCGNIYRDSIMITLDPSYDLELGGPIGICPGDSVEINVQSSHTDYEWFTDGVGISCTDCPNPTISPDTTTRYTLVAQDANCFAGDTLTVSILPVYNIMDTIGLCPGDTVTVFGQSVSAAGTFEQTFSSVFGCDSTMQIVVQPLQNIETASSDTICSGQSAVIFGNTVSTPGPYSETFNSVAGCDSTHTINLVVLDPIMSSEELNLCSGDTLQLFGQEVTMPVVLTDTLSGVDGCDSIHQVTVNFLDTLITVDSLVICEGDTVDIFGTPTATGGTYQQTFLSTNGCDSTHFIVLSIQPPIETSEVVSICTGESYDTWGLSLTMPGVYDSTFVSVAGCDSTHTITLSVQDTITTQESISICQGEAADIFGNPESAAGDYSMTFSGSNNCDSTHTISLSVLDTFATAETISLCQGDTVQVFGQFVTDSGNFSQTFMSTGGCDSTHTVTVNVLDTVFTSENVQICAGDTLDVFGTPTFEAGTFEATFTGANGCDSTHQIVLSVQDTIFTTAETVICEGESVAVFGQDISAEGDYTQAFTSSSGCDSLHTISVSVLDTVATFATEVLCEGDSVLLFGDWVTTAGTYSESYTAANGCDSTSYVDVSLADSVLVQSQSVICEGDSLLIFGQFETTAGTYSQVFTAASGCDSTEVVVLNVLNTSETSLSVSHCTGDSTLIFGQFETEAGTYEETFSNALGCDSTVTVVLEVFEAPNLSVDTQPACPAEENGSIAVSTTGGNPPFDFSWGHTAANTGILDNLAAGTYEVTVTGSNGCTAEITTEVASEEVPAFSLQPSGVGCEGEADGSLSISGPATLTYSLDGENFNADTLITGLDTGQYTLFVQSASGCVLTENFTIDPAAALSLGLPTDLEVILGDSVQLQPQGDLGAFSSFEWTPPTWLSCVDCPAPFATPQRNITYTLMAVDTSGCAVDAQVSIRVLQERDIYAPNVFSPNNDGRNDVFKPLAGRDYEVLSFRVFNRWGGLLHEEENVRLSELSGWDGQVNGEPMSGGVYLYQLELRLPDGREEASAGEVVLLR